MIISRNEERNIGRCIESVLNAIEGIDKSEVILVDSASTDRTIEIAKNYPIRILQLRPEWPLSASAGRHIGYLNAHGKYIHFQDGDGTAYKNWFKEALPILEEDGGLLVGLVGITTQEPYTTKAAIQFIKANKPEHLVFGDIEFVSGPFTLKKSVLSEIGSFNPYLKSGEEGELCTRIISAGYTLSMVPYYMYHHYGYFTEIKVIDRIRGARHQGQILRSTLNDKKIFWWRLREYKFKVIPAFFIVLGFLFVGVFLSFGNRLPLFILAGGLLLYFVCVLAVVRDLKRAIRLATSHALKAIPFIFGFLEPKKDPKTYPTDVQVIKQ